MAAKKYALVQWLDGADKNKMTVLNSSWVKGIETWNTGDEESFVVEWHDTPRQPVGGWKCYDARIINTSDHKNELERELKIASQKTEPVCKIPGADFLLDTSFDDSDADPHYIPEVQQAEHKHQDLFKKRKREAETDVKKSRPQLEVKEVKKSGLQEYLESEFKKIHHRFDKIEKKLNDQHTLVGQDEQQSTSSQGVAGGVSGIKKVELHPGTGILVDEVAWVMASSAQSAGAFISTLLVNLFPEEVLLTSNLKGGANKSDPSGERKAPLDPKIIQALKLAALKKFPTLTAGRFGAYVNNKLGNLRYKLKNVQNVSD